MMVTPLRFGLGLVVIGLGLVVFPALVAGVLGILGAFAAGLGAPVAVATTAAPAGAISLAGGVLLALWAGYKVMAGGDS